jgi:hypothetical protein
MADENLQISTKFLAKAIAGAYRDGMNDEHGRIVKLLETILTDRASKAAIYSRTIGIDELLKLIGENRG